MSQTPTQMSQPTADQPRTLDRERKKMLDAWVSFLIVSIVLSIIFPYDPFWAVIPKIVLFIQAIRCTIEYSNFKKSSRHNIEMTPSQPIHISSPVQSPTSGTFCPMCGVAHDESSKFCASCGTSLE
ncbi:zinc ribbon domain-containing protein [Candidatus Lokiarchaeum ossiferum]|uniref:zinc ribbon domain-containing protein n=1 Tax=Candidatus Lokiarchaeum ossiferum TaxID=2951803 RepID=UPI00352CE36C